MVHCEYYYKLQVIISGIIELHHKQINKENKELLDLRSRSVDELSKLQYNMKNESDVTPSAEEKLDFDDDNLRGETNISYIVHRRVLNIQYNVFPF